LTAIFAETQTAYPLLELRIPQFTLTQMSVMIGITVSNEEQNIGTLLEYLVNCAPSEVEAIFIVSSGSTDRTNDIVESYCQQDTRIQLIKETERNGKAAALNLLLAYSENFDYMVYMGGDNIPCRDALPQLLSALKSLDVEIVGGHPLPVDSPNNFMGFCSHLLWNLHHESSLKNPKISGELMVFKTRIIRELPPAIINDDAYIQALGELKRCKIAYCPEAEVLLKGPSTMSDFITQRRRVFIGHKQLEFLIGRKVSTMKVPSMKNLMNACPFKGLKGRVYLVGFIMLQGIALLLARWDFARHKLPIKWPMVKTTKNLHITTDAILLTTIEPLGVRR
jgi:cellulose synthase/poly-beta-1,6-N-acetylglucosamine synthase-like glycosyltransferase